MPRKHQIFRRTIAIVCEDSVVTPTYLGMIREEVIGQGHWSNIDIFPIPPSDITTVKNDIPGKSKRKIRSFAGETNDIPLDIEEKYKAVPVRYVREAQLHIIEGGYDEGWAAYDLNGHTKHEEAYALSLAFPTIHLAFTSIAIEHWFLLHFVRDNTAYSKSKEVPIQKYLPSYKKTATESIDTYKLMRPYLEIALENAAWLRTINSRHARMCYQINPYIDMDLLIKNLYGISETISWGSLNEPFQIRGIEFLIVRNNPELRVNIQNHSSKGIVSKQITFFAFDLNRTKSEFKVKFSPLLPGDSVVQVLDLKDPSLFNVCFDGYRTLIEL